MPGKIEGKKRRGWQRVRWLDSITDSTGMSLSKLWEMVEDSGAWHATLHGVAKSKAQLGDCTTTAIMSQVLHIHYLTKYPQIYKVHNINPMYHLQIKAQLVQFSSVAQSCLTLCNPINQSTPVLPVHHQLPEFTQTHVHRVGDAIQPAQPLSSPSPPAPNPSQHQGLFQ